MNGITTNMHHGGNLALLCRLTAQDSAKKWIDFSANINPLGLPEELKQAMHEAIESVVEYPDYTYHQLKQAIAAHYRVHVDHILVGNGATELLDVLMQALPQTIVLIEPSFSEYRIVANRYQKNILAYRLDDQNDFTLNTGDLLQWLDQQTIEVPINASEVTYKAAVFVCNPSNPTGKLIHKRALIELAYELCQRQIALVIDQSFIDFVCEEQERTLHMHLAEMPNVVLLHSLTKFYALPGIRLGFALCSNRSLCGQAATYQYAWSINRLAEVAGIKLFSLTEFATTSRQYCCRERQFLQTHLEKDFAIRVFPAAANFMLIQTTLPNFYQKMLEQGIVVRSCANYIGLDETYFRLAVRTHEENGALLKALELSYGSRT